MRFIIRQRPAEIEKHGNYVVYAVRPEAIYVYSLQAFACTARGGRFEYLHRNAESRTRCEKGPPCVGVELGHPVPGGYKYEALALHVGGVLNLRQ